MNSETLRALNKRFTARHEWMAHSDEAYPVPLDWFKAHCSRFYFTDAEILAAAVNVWPAQTSGVYFLVRDGEIVYVGQAKNIRQRIEQHDDSGKIFDAIAWLEAPLLFLNDIEAYYIYRIRPRENIREPSFWEGIELLKQLEAV